MCAHMSELEGGEGEEEGERRVTKLYNYQTQAQTQNILIQMTIKMSLIYFNDQQFILGSNLCLFIYLYVCACLS